MIYFAAQVTEETIPHIIEELARWDLNVEDDLDGILDDPTLPGDHYGIMTYRMINPKRSEVTFYTMWYKDFARNFRFVGEIQGPCFRQVQKI